MKSLLIVPRDETAGIFNVALKSNLVAGGKHWYIHSLFRLLPSLLYWLTSADLNTYVDQYSLRDASLNNDCANTCEAIHNAYRCSKAMILASLGTNYAASRKKCACCLYFVMCCCLKSDVRSAPHWTTSHKHRSSLIYNLQASATNTSQTIIT